MKDGIFLHEKFADDVHEKRVMSGGRHIMSLRTISDITGIHYSTISRVINGESPNPDLQTLIALCKWMNKSPDNYIK